jgi:hypothetical protein
MPDSSVTSLKGQHTVMNELHGPRCVRTFSPVDVKARLPGYQTMTATVRAPLLRRSYRLELRLMEEPVPPEVAPPPK